MKLYMFGFVETQVPLSSPGTKGNEILLRSKVSEKEKMELRHLVSSANIRVLDEASDRGGKVTTVK